MANPPINAIRGMNDILPQDTIYWQWIEKILRDILHSYGYQEIRFPILEKTELFKRSIGDATDIVEKEMYTFLDRNNESLALRPEGTASCVRAGNEHGLLYNQIQRFWSLGPYFRYERPQKGRYRQFHQCDVEAFGLAGPDIDAEIILLTAKILEKLGLQSYVTLELNSLGSVAARHLYREELVNYFSSCQDQLDEDSQRRLTTNPLRILDSKNPTMQHLIEQAPRLLDYLDTESAQHFEKLKDYLTSAGITFTVNPRLVRGLDYYTKTVFEWVTTELGAQGTVCAGGRYDGLVEQLGGKPTPAIGFALGMERIILLVQQQQPHIDLHLAPHIYFMSDSDATFKTAMHIANSLRDLLPGIRIIVHCGGGAFKNQFKKADKSGAQIALLIGEQEQQIEAVTVKFLRDKTEQMTIKTSDLHDFLKQKQNLGL